MSISNYNKILKEFYRLTKKDKNLEPHTFDLAASISLFIH